MWLINQAPKKRTFRFIWRNLMNCKHFFEKRKNSIKRCWQSAVSVLLYKMSSQEGSEVENTIYDFRPMLRLQKCISGHYNSLELGNNITAMAWKMKSGTAAWKRFERKIKKFLTDKTVYDNINKLSLMRTTKSFRKRQSSLITEQ